MVTSRAVVGSSQMSSLGRVIMAMAIMALWRIPPESAEGIGLQDSLRVGDLDAAHGLQAALVGLALLHAGVVHAQGLHELVAMVNSGFMAVIGSWKTMAISLPRMGRSCLGVMCRRSLPSKRICPRGSACALRG